jgi:hypothetical protein
MPLFQACTSLQVGNGARVLFWKDTCHDGIAFQYSFPELFNLARRKNITVQTAMNNGRWMKGLQRINSPSLIDQFVKLWSSLQLVQLSDTADTITWRQSNDNTYSAASAYEACFLGRVQKPLIAAAWDVRTEGKIKFFLWLLIQNRLWTADRLQARGWPHQDKCCLCDQLPENVDHLFLECSYSKEVWHGLSFTYSDAADIATRSNTVSGWWKKIVRLKKSKAKRDQVSAAVYGVWNLWKERNRRIFENISDTPENLLYQIRDGLANLKAAYRE